MRKFDAGGIHSTGRCGRPNRGDVSVLVTDFRQLTCGRGDFDFATALFLGESTITMCVDNIAVIGVVVTGAATSMADRRSMSTFRRAISMLSFPVWFGRVTSSWNCAGCPSRGTPTHTPTPTPDNIPFETRHDCPFDMSPNIGNASIPVPLEIDDGEQGRNSRFYAEGNGIELDRYEATKKVVL